MVVVAKALYKGLSFEEVGKLHNVVCTWATSPTQKISHRGTFTVDVHKNSYLFPKEVVLTVWSREYPDLNNLIRRADNDGYWRLEIPIPITDFYELMKEDVLSEIEARLEEVEEPDAESGDPHGPLTPEVALKIRHEVAEINRKPP